MQLSLGFADHDNPAALERQGFLRIDEDDHILKRSEHFVRDHAPAMAGGRPGATIRPLCVEVRPLSRDQACPPAFTITTDQGKIGGAGINDECEQDPQSQRVLAD